MMIPVISPLRAGEMECGGGEIGSKDIAITIFKSNKYRE
jgi:hypothetical protein